MNLVQRRVYDRWLSIFEDRKQEGAGRSDTRINDNPALLAADLVH